MDRFAVFLLAFGCEAVLTGLYSGLAVLGGGHRPYKTEPDSGCRMMRDDAARCETMTVGRQTIVLLGG